MCEELSGGIRRDLMYFTITSSNAGALRNVEYLFTAIALRSTLAQSGST